MIVYTYVDGDSRLIFFHSLPAAFQVWVLAGLVHGALACSLAHTTKALITERTRGQQQVFLEGLLVLLHERTPTCTYRSVEIVKFCPSAEWKLYVFAAGQHSAIDGWRWSELASSQVGALENVRRDATRRDATRANDRPTGRLTSLTSDR